MAERSAHSPAELEHNLAQAFGCDYTSETLSAIRNHRRGSSPGARVCLHFLSGASGATSPGVPKAGRTERNVATSPIAVSNPRGGRSAYFIDGVVLGGSSIANASTCAIVDGGSIITPFAGVIAAGIRPACDNAAVRSRSTRSKTSAYSRVGEGSRRAGRIRRFSVSALLSFVAGA